MAGFEVRQGQGKIVQPIKTNRITNNTKGTMRGFIFKKKIVQVVDKVPFTTKNISKC